MTADLAISLATPFIEYLIKPIGRRCGYMVFYKRYLKELEAGVDKLKDELEGVEHQCETARRNGMNVETKVQKWFDGVSEAVAVATIHSKDDFQRCFCLNPVTCYKKGRKAKKQMLVVQQLKEERTNLGDISYEAPIRPKLSAKDYESLGSRSEIVENIMKALGDENVRVIGVSGMGGVGKSTLMKEVIRLAEEKNLFRDVAIATVSQNPDVKKIQGELAVWLDIKFTDNEDILRRAARLGERLKVSDKKKVLDQEVESKKIEDQMLQRDKQSSKEVLLILDDLWNGIALEEVIGIPQDAGGIKLLLTSRNQHVLSGQMGCHPNHVFKLDVLKGDEPWSLFQSIVGEIDSDRASMGKGVVEKCSGLPIVLKAIARTLKNCSLSEWKNAVEQVKGSKDAYSNLELSYRHLESEELKSLFLVCALTNNVDISVKDLLYYGMGLGLFRGTNTVRNASDKMKLLLRSLQASSLLLEDEAQDPGYVKIHDVVREVAIRIASQDQYSFMVTDGSELKEIPREKLKKSRAISIPYVDFQTLPERWECPELKMLLIYRRKDDSHVDIPDSFFQGMKELKVVHISGRCFDSLPSSIQLLPILTTLCLDRCSMAMDLTIIGKLKQLQILTFRGSEIARLSKEIGELTSLKVLDLSECTKLETIEPQVLGSLTSLEELHMRGSSFLQWENEGELKAANARVSEINNMCNLSSVNLLIRDVCSIPKQLDFQNLVEYIIQIGDAWDWSGEYTESRTLNIKLELSRNNMLREKWAQDLLKRTQDLHLYGLEGRKMSLHELCLDGFPELKLLYVRRSPSVHCVTHSTYEWLPCTAFTVLELLILENLTGLEMICRGPVAGDSFRNLKVIKVWACEKLEYLFSNSMLKGISQLEVIEVTNCEAMKEIVIVDSDAIVRLQALHMIWLYNLPNFTSFYSRPKVEVDHNSEIVQEDQCIPTANTLFLNEQLVSFPLLKKLVLVSLPQLKYIWQNNCLVEVTNLEYLVVKYCNDLLTVIPSSLVKEVRNLETMVVQGCESVQEVFGSIDVLNLTSNVEFLSRLNWLRLEDLPCLRHIWENNHQLDEKVRVFQNLDKLEVENCNSLRNLFPAAVVKGLNKINRIYIKNCEKMEEVVPAAEEEEEEMTNLLFQLLADVWLEDLPNMVTFVRTKRGEFISFPSLMELYVKNCPNMRAFYLLKEDASPLQLCFFDDKVLGFPKLARLDLVSMGSIKRIWHEKCFCQLEVFVVMDCQNIVDVIPAIKLTGIGRVGQILHNLKEITISTCPSLVGPIFKFEADQDIGCKKGILLPHLQKLGLHILPKLEHVIQPTSHVIIGFPSLTEIPVSDCQCVIELLPIATAKTLSKLTKLEVYRCPSMRQVFGKEVDTEEEDHEMLDSIIFPCLHSINVQRLDSLMCFFFGTSCVLDFPCLEEIEMAFCLNLKTFVQSRRHTSDQTLEESATFTNEAAHYYLFDDKVELPNLKTIKLLQMNSLHAIWKTQLLCVGYGFGQITTIYVEHCEKFEVIMFESDDGEREVESIEEPAAAVFHSLAGVSLTNLPNIVAFLRVRRHRSVSFPCLENLAVRHCPMIRSFYLSYTEESCDESIPLCFFDHKVQTPTLSSLILNSTESIVKIWHKDISVESFCQLEALVVQDCQNFVNIFPSKYVIGTHRAPFQHLKMFLIDECYSLEGSLFQFLWNGEEKLGEQSFSLPQLKKICLRKLPRLEHLIQPTSHVIIGFPNLDDITVANCDCLIDIFPTAVAATLSKLEKLHVIQCTSMRHVFGKEEEDAMLDLVVPFPCLRSILLTDLDSLICFFLGTASQLKFPSLEDIYINTCPILKTFIQSQACDSKSADYLFDDKQVEFPNLQTVYLNQLSSFQTIWRNEMCPSSESCTRLKSLTMLYCKDLQDIFPTSSALEETVMHDGNSPFRAAGLQHQILTNFIIKFPTVEFITVAGCPRMLNNSEEENAD